MRSLDLISSLAVTLLLGMGLLSPLPTETAEVPLSSGKHPDISGDRIVWADDRTGNWDIFMLDLTTGREEPICTNPKDQMYPAISGHRVVWVDYRSRKHFPDIYMYDVVTGRETSICAAKGSQNGPAISGDLIVWQDWRYPGIYMYELDPAAYCRSAIGQSEMDRETLASGREGAIARMLCLQKKPDADLCK